MIRKALRITTSPNLRPNNSHRWQTEPFETRHDQNDASHDRFDEPSADKHNDVEHNYNSPIYYTKIVDHNFDGQNMAFHNRHHASRTLNGNLHHLRLEESTSATGLEWNQVHMDGILAPTQDQNVQ